MSSGPPPNYYSILSVSENATPQQIRSAYKKAALKTHPDRVPSDSPERESRTRRFQLVNDAYYTLSDAGRRRQYDAQRRLFGTSNPTGAGGSNSSPGSEEEEDEIPIGGDPSAGGGAGGAQQQSAYSWAWNFFTKQTGASGEQARQRAESEQFGDAFEEMLREEGMAEPDGSGNTRPTGAFWSMVGSVSGGALGFIVANVPGLVAGAVAGNRLGAVRDARGKSVYAVYQDLPQADKARLLSQLAAKVLSHAVSA